MGDDGSSKKRQRLSSDAEGLTGDQEPSNSSPTLSSQSNGQESSNSGLTLSSRSGAILFSQLGPILSSQLGGQAPSNSDSNGQESSKAGPILSSQSVSQEPSNSCPILSSQSDIQQASTSSSNQNALHSSTIVPNSNQLTQSANLSPLTFQRYTPLKPEEFPENNWQNYIRCFESDPTIDVKVDENLLATVNWHFEGAPKNATYTLFTYGMQLPYCQTYSRKEFNGKTQKTVQLKCPIPHLFIVALTQPTHRSFCPLAKCKLVKIDSNGVQNMETEGSTLKITKVDKNALVSFSFPNTNPDSKYVLFDIYFTGNFSCVENRFNLIGETKKKIDLKQYDNHVILAGLVSDEDEDVFESMVYKCFRPVFNQEDVSERFQRMENEFLSRQNESSWKENYEPVECKEAYHCKNKDLWCIPDGQLFNPRMFKSMQVRSGHLCNNLSFNSKFDGVWLSITPGQTPNSLPPDSVYGNVRFRMKIKKLLNVNSMNLWFADFWCSRCSLHYVTLVVTDKGSTKDKYCQRKFHKLDFFNNRYLCAKKDENNELTFWTIKRESGFYPEILFLENLPFEWSDFEQDEVEPLCELGQKRYGTFKSCDLCRE